MTDKTTDKILEEVLKETKKRRIYSGDIEQEMEWTILRKELIYPIEIAVQKVTEKTKKELYLKESCIKELERIIGLRDLKILDLKEELEDQANEIFNEVNKYSEDRFEKDETGKKPRSIPMRLMRKDKLQELKQKFVKGVKK